MNRNPTSPTTMATINDMTIKITGSIARRRRDYLLPRIAPTAPHEAAPRLTVQPSVEEEEETEMIMGRGGGAHLISRPATVG